MKKLLQSTIGQITSDRKMTLLCIGMIVGGIVFMVYTAVSLSASDLQLAIRYSSFGETHFYREKWWYLLSFTGFGLLFLIAHVGMLAKLCAIGMKDLAYGFAWLSIIVLLLAFAYTYSVFGIAYLN